MKGDMVYVNPKAQFIPPMEFCIGPNPDLEIGQDVYKRQGITRLMVL